MLRWITIVETLGSGPVPNVYPPVELPVSNRASPPALWLQVPHAYLISTSPQCLIPVSSPTRYHHCHHTTITATITVFFFCFPTLTNRPQRLAPMFCHCLVRFSFPPLRERLC